jgi:GNAT superfamily N-acetyltransferase
MEAPKRLQRAQYIPSGYAALVAGELDVREAQPGDARAIAEVSVASRRWSYRDLFPDADLEALSVEDTTADFAEGLAGLPPGAAVFVAELTGHVVGYAYVLPSPDVDVPAQTSELGSIYITEEVAGTGVARDLMNERSSARVQPDKVPSRCGCAERTAAPVASTRSVVCSLMVASAHVRTTSCRSRCTRFATGCRSEPRRPPARGLDDLFNP